MADPSLRLPINAPGNFYVDSACVVCDVCTTIAPRVFGTTPRNAFVSRQPETDGDVAAAERALSECPQYAIGSVALTMREDAE